MIDVPGAHSLKRFHHRLLRSPVWSSLLIGLLGCLTAAAATMARGGVPAPRVHDEFSYLLAADTYAHGRLTNPTPALWEHFETWHVIQVPTYASKFPPAQGLALAVGQVLTGQPIVGVWLSYGLLCGALTWMLLGWVRPRWALWGGVFACFWLVGRQAMGAAYEPAYWATSYWGGAVAATGGALLFGGLRRILDRPRVMPAIVTALGLGVLANSRPAEGLIVALVPCSILALWLVRNRFLRVLVPMAAVLLIVGAWMAWNNYRVTGSVWKLPYLTYEAQYGTVGPFRWLRKGQPSRAHLLPTAYREKVRRDSAFGEGGVRNALTLGTVRRFYLPFYALVLLAAAVLVLRDRWARAAFASVGLVTAALAAETWNLAHYAAPAVGPLVIVFVLGARRLGVLRPAGARVGTVLVRIVLGCAAVWAFVAGVESFGQRRQQQQAWPARRQAMIAELSARGGRHLVLVTYGRRHTPGAEWVFNSADLDAAPVLWARSLGPEPDRALLAHYSNRTVWRLTADDDRGPFTLQPADR